MSSFKNFVLMTDKINHINNYFNIWGNLVDLIKDWKEGDVRSMLLLLPLDHGDTCSRCRNQE